MEAEEECRNLRERRNLRAAHSRRFLLAVRSLRRTRPLRAPVSRASSSERPPPGALQGPSSPSRPGPRGGVLQSTARGYDPRRCLPARPPARPRALRGWMCASFSCTRQQGMRSYCSHVLHRCGSEHDARAGCGACAGRGACCGEQVRSAPSPGAQGRLGPPQGWVWSWIGGFRRPLLHTSIATETCVSEL